MIVSLSDGYQFTEQTLHRLGINPTVSSRKGVMAAFDKAHEALVLAICEIQHREVKMVDEKRWEVRADSVEYKGYETITQGVYAECHNLKVVARQHNRHAELRLRCGRQRYEPCAKYMNGEP